jgi:signal transduction histidine kinase/CheY-like chemotaxis protein
MDVAIRESWRHFLSPWRRLNDLSLALDQPPLSQRIARQQFRSFLTGGRQSIFTAASGVVLWVLGLWHVNPSIWVILWAVFSWFNLGAMGILLFRFAKNNATLSDKDLRGWEIVQGRLSFVVGAQFGTVGFLVPSDMTLYAPYITMGLLLTVVNSLSLSVIYRPSIVWMVVPLAALHFVAMLRGGELLPVVLGMGFFITVGILIQLAYFQNTLMSRSLQHAEERLVLLGEIELSRAQAQQANQAKTRFLAAVSHDLRQPIHSISLLTNVLSRRAAADTALHRQISASVQAMDDMLDGLLEVSKLDIGHLPLRLGPVYLPALLERLQLQFQAQANEKGLELTIMTAELWTHSDSEELHRLLANLVSNALRYTQQGRVLIRVRERGPWLWLQVWDSGLGIARQDRARIFDEFVQISAHAPEQLQTKGVGLGLSIVQRIAHRLDHHCIVRSRPGRGSLFAVRVSQVSAPTPSSDAGTADALLDKYLAGRLVLLIEDDATVRQSMLVLLRSLNCHVLEAYSSETALSSVDNTLRTPDLIITDYQLGVSDTGLQAIMKVREAVDENVPAVLITAERNPPHESAARLGVPVLSKPLKPRDLALALSDLLANLSEKSTEG